MKKIRLRTAVENLTSNWYFPVGAAAFYCANVQWYYEGIFVPDGLWIAVLLCAVFAALTPSLLGRVHRMNGLVKILAAMSAAGIFWDPAYIPLGGISFSGEAEYLTAQILGQQMPPVLGELAVAAGWLFVFLCVAMLFDKLMQIFKETELLRGIPIWEWAVYGVILMISALVILVVFDKTQAFYGGAGYIYSGDAFYIVPQGLYVNLFHVENDFHQPMFAVFAAPFTGIAYFLGALVYRWPTAQMVLLDYSQLGLIFMAGFIFAKMLELDPVKRLCFMVLFCSTYMYMLFVLMMEQYAVAVFWLALYVYLIRCRRCEVVAMAGAGGAMITSLVLVPVAQKEDPRKNFAGWFWSCAKQGIAFVVIMLAFCRLDVFLKLRERILAMLTFTGQDVSFGDKVMQYFAFVRNCYLAPQGVIDFEIAPEPAWWQAPVAEVSILGVVLLALTLLSLWLNRDKRSSRLCGYWVAFSVAILVIGGWGADENGFLLYTLYFGWAYYGLLFQLLQWMADKWKRPWLVPVCTAGLVAGMLRVNIPGMMEMIDFAVSYYPG